MGLRREAGPDARGERYGFLWHRGVIFWPASPIFFWGIFVGVHSFSAHHSFGRGWVQKETEKILGEEEGRGP